jgi:hypothetical protein
MGMHTLRFCVNQIINNADDAQNETKELMVKLTGSKEYDAIAEADSKLDEIKSAAKHIKETIDLLTPFN